MAHVRLEGVADTGEGIASCVLRLTLIIHSKYQVWVCREREGQRRRRDDDLAVAAERRSERNGIQRKGAEERASPCACSKVRPHECGVLESNTESGRANGWG